MLCKRHGRDMASRDLVATWQVVKRSQSYQTNYGRFCFNNYVTRTLFVLTIMLQELFLFEQLCY